MTHGDVDNWLNRYIQAWQSYDAEAIGRLFSEDAAYYYSPFKKPFRTRGAIVAWWLEDPDTTGTYEAEYYPIAVEGDVAVAHRRTRYTGAVTREFGNSFTMGFNDAGECTEFREWYVERQKA